MRNIGNDISEVVKAIKDQLSRFNYSSDEIRVSEAIISQFDTVSLKTGASEYERVTHFMDLRNHARKLTKDNSILMKGIARQIYLQREKDQNRESLPRKRNAYIIKTLKHPEEVEFMRDTYRDAFYLIGVTSSYERRVNYLVSRKGLLEEYARELLERDANEDIKQGQHTQDAF